MALNSTGDSNRISGRDFLEKNIQIENFDGRHTINIAIPSEKKNDRPLVKAQRIELNKLVAAIVEAGAEEAYEVWQRVHAEIGVSSIEEMTVNQYPTAVSFLQAMLDRIKEAESNKFLVHVLLKNTSDGESRQRLIRYCHVNFGTGRLANLTGPQLRQALTWSEDKRGTESTSDPEHYALKPGWYEVFNTYHKEVLVVFVAGVLLGALIF